MAITNEQRCEKQNCNETYIPHPCKIERFCPKHQREWDNAYDDHVDPLHAYHAHNPDRAISSGD